MGEGRAACPALIEQGREGMGEVKNNAPRLGAFWVYLVRLNLLLFT
jgi:hypothetical protein